MKKLKILQNSFDVNPALHDLAPARMKYVLTIVHMRVYLLRTSLLQY